MNKHNVDRAAVLALFKGKGLEKATAAMDMLEQSMTQGFWVKGASRKVLAALLGGKVRREFIKAGDVFDVFRGNEAAFAMHMACRYGSVMRFLPEYEAQLKKLPGIQADLQLGLQLVNALRPVALTINDLNATRSPPVFTKIGASRTVTATVEGLGTAKIDVCPIEWEKVESVDKNGKTVFSYIGKLVWPRGTQHGTSRFTGRHQCQACGHAIHNPFNWVPLISTDDDGKAKSLWVGRDCAKTLFGIHLEGDLELVKEDAHGG